jgi:hypothetical protein
MVLVVLVVVVLVVLLLMVLVLVVLVVVVVVKNRLASGQLLTAPMEGIEYSSGHSATASQHPITAPTTAALTTAVVTIAALTTAAVTVAAITPAVTTALATALITAALMTALTIAEVMTYEQSRFVSLAARSECIEVMTYGRSSYTGKHICVIVMRQTTLAVFRRRSNHHRSQHRLRQDPKISISYRYALAKKEHVP